VNWPVNREKGKFMEKNGEVAELLTKIRAFNAEREWQRFHSPKNLAMALGVEVAELSEHFQWLTGEQSRKLSPAKTGAVAEEIADVLIYLLNLADQLGIDPVAAAHEKIIANAGKYPAEEVRGRADFEKS